MVQLINHTLKISNGQLIRNKKFDIFRHLRRTGEYYILAFFYYAQNYQDNIV
jgi:hypothetical protein